MDQRWARYLHAQKADAGRALVNQGTRIERARRELPESGYRELLSQSGLTARDAEMLVVCARALEPLLKALPRVRLPFRTRTLAALADQSMDAVFEAGKTGLIGPSMTEGDAKSLTPRGRPNIASVIRPSDS